MFTKLGLEEVELVGEGAEFVGPRAFFGQGGFAFGGQFGIFEVGQDFPCSLEDGLGETGQPRNLDAVALVGGAGDDFAEEDDVVVPFADCDVAISHTGAGAGEVGQFVVVGGEEGAAGGDVMKMLGHAPSDGEAVEGRGAPADFVEDDEAAVGRVVENGGGFVHFDHEGGLSAREVVGRANAGEDAVDDPDLGLCCGDKAAGLGEEDEEGDLADVGAFAGHVGAGEDDEAGGIGVEHGVVGHEAGGCIDKRAGECDFRR